MTFQDMRKRAEQLQYLGFERSRRMWVYAYRDIHHKTRIFGLSAGRKAIELPSLAGLELTKQ